MTKAKFKIGDNVRLTNFGFTYTTYEEMFELMGFKDTQSNSKVKGKEVGTIFGVQLHEDQDTILYAIRTADDREALIGEKGLVKVEDAPKVYSEAEVYDILVKHTLELFGAEPCTLDEFFEKVKKK